MADSDEGTALQQAMQQIDQLHHTLTQAVAGFDHLFADHGAPAAASDPESAELQQICAQLNTLAHALSDDIGQKLLQNAEALQVAGTAAATQTQNHATQWSAIYGELGPELQKLEQLLEQAAAGATSTLGELHSGLDTATHATTDLLHNVEQSAQKLQTELSDTVTPTLKKASDAFHEGIASTLTGHLTEHLTSIYQTAGHALDDLAQTATHVSQDFSHNAESAMQSFATGVEEGLKHQLETAGERLAKDAMEALSALVTTAIAEITAGASVTTAMAPILPEVIVVKEASEAIKDLISVFKAVASVF